MINTNKLSVIIFIGLIIILTLTSCAQQSSTPIATETIQGIQTPTSYTPTQAPTFTPLPTFSPVPITTNTPNFSPPIATNTLLPKVTCPPIDQNKTIDFTDFKNSLQINTRDDLERALETAKDSLLAYMSAGGTAEYLKEVFQQEQNKQEPDYLGDVQTGDLTGDGIPEVLIWVALPSSEEALPGLLTIDWIKQFFPMPVLGTRTYVFGCNQGKYELLGTIKDDYYNDSAMPTIADLNADGIAEVVQPIFSFAGSGYGIYISILNWDGSQFINVLQGELREDWISSFSEGSLFGNKAYVRAGNFNLQDIDNNGTTEVVITSKDNRGLQTCELLYRETRMVLMWNGDHFIGFYWRTPPIYRIHAVWDGDHASLHGLTDQALSVYQEVLDDKTLLPWSPDYTNLAYPLCSHIPGSTPLPTNPLPDEDEASRLMSYSLYRIMLLKIVRGDLLNAEEYYKLLQANYKNSYQELAVVFWKKYSNTKDISLACQAAIDYAESNQELVLNSLDRYTYGSLTPIYQPEDICPYK